MDHTPSLTDRGYLSSLEQKNIDTASFDHRGHLRIAYTLLADSDVDEAYHRLREDLLALLEHLGVGTAKYHETLTYAWLLAVNHFMHKSDTCRSFDEFLSGNELLLDQQIMLSHYSKDLLFSDRARQAYIPPDLEGIPAH